MHFEKQKHVRTDSVKRNYDAHKDNRFLKNRTEEVEYYSNLNEKDLTDSKMNWKTAKPLFLKK